jgi:hypothetical protein
MKFCTEEKLCCVVYMLQASCMVFKIPFVTHSNTQFYISLQVVIYYFKYMGATPHAFPIV